MNRVHRQAHRRGCANRVALAQTVLSPSLKPMNENVIMMERERFNVL